jgi:hypothetical protein
VLLATTKRADKATDLAALHGSTSGNEYGERAAHDWCGSDAERHTRACANLGTGGRTLPRTLARGRLAG